MTMGSAWRAVDRPAPSYDSSSEFVQRAAALQIINQLSAQISIQEDLWANRDADWAQATNRPLVGTTIKPVDPRSVYVGHRLSLQDAPQDTFPAITVRCMNTVASDDREQPDQYDANDLQLIIEVWVSTGPYSDPVKNQADSEEIDRQLHRLSDAVRGCISADRSLGGVTVGIKRPPRAVGTLPFARKADSSNTGPKFLVQAMELTYTITSFEI